MVAIAKLLAEHNISVNSISAYYHDYLFFSVSRRHEAMSLLEEFPQSFRD